jgi:hypothetical protein
MDISKYLNIKSSNNGTVISKFITDLYNKYKYKYKDILFIRTYTTGNWLDDLFTESQDITRILYYTDKMKCPTIVHKSTKIIHSNELENNLMALNKTFDLICIDSWHEYTESSRDFRIIPSFLNESGIVISHDCYPWNKKVANPQYIFGPWCGETYLSFVKFAYDNPNLFYTVINIDTGIGICSKKQLLFLSNTLDRKKQKQLLFLHKTTPTNVYKYFINNSKDIINAVSF